MIIKLRRQYRRYWTLGRRPHASRRWRFCALWCDILFYSIKILRFAHFSVTFYEKLHIYWDLRTLAWHFFLLAQLASTLVIKICLVTPKCAKSPKYDAISLDFGNINLSLWHEGTGPWPQKMPLSTERMEGWNIVLRICKNFRGTYVA